MRIVGPVIKIDFYWKMEGENLFYKPVIHHIL